MIKTTSHYWHRVSTLTLLLGTISACVSDHVAEDIHLTGMCAHMAVMAVVITTNNTYILGPAINQKRVLSFRLFTVSFFVLVLRYFKSGSQQIQ